MYVAAFIASLIVSQGMGLKAYAAILWIPIFVSCFACVVQLTAPLVSPLKVANAHESRAPGIVQRNLILFLAFWLGAVFIVLIYGYVLGWLAFLLGGSRGDILENADMWSYPLRWINPMFAVRPDKSFVAVIGIVSANCYFYALGLTLVFSVVHRLLRRNRITELGISRGTLHDDDLV